jgi:hypothetical protein
MGCWVDRSAIGTASRRKGAEFERAVARYLQQWVPSARRGRDNGSEHTDDQGDIAGIPRLWVSLKNCAVRRTAAWMSEARLKCGGRIPVLVMKRPGCADPGSAEVVLSLDDLHTLIGDSARGGVDVTLTLHDLMRMMHDDDDAA